MRELNIAIATEEMRRALHDVLGFGSENGCEFLLRGISEEGENVLIFHAQRYNFMKGEHGRWQRFRLTITPEPCTPIETTGASDDRSDPNGGTG